ncbi:hypothetical protein U9M48_010892 [Paspalum notatum var. saurae]|uniref:CCHC-type domain-containing protein n=1 Tax=Paspalum notatum var. saurae TaxID=547442 RepID=A0AAQ3SU72_PASNO
MDRLALAAIHSCISKDNLIKIAHKKTAKEAWQALRTMHLGTEPLMMFRAMDFSRELEAMTMKDLEPIDDFVTRVMMLVVNIRAHGGKVEESYIVRKILRAVPPKFKDIACVIEVLCDLESMTIEDLVGRLKTYEFWLLDRGLRTPAEWEAEMKKRDREGRGGRGDHGHGEGESCSSSVKKDRKFNKGKVRCCYNCRDYGHFAAECRKPKKQE